MPVADFVLRNVRVVELGRGRGWVGPVDVFVEQGTVREIGHGLDHPAGIEEYDARGTLADPRAVGPARPPGPVDRSPRSGSTWPAPRRPRRPLALVGERLGDRARTCWSSPGPPHRPVGRAAHGRRARRGRAPTYPVVLIAGDAPPRLAQHPRPDAPRPAGARLGGRARPSGSRPTRGSVTWSASRRHLAGGVPAHPRRRPPPSASSASSTSSSRAAAADWAERWPTAATVLRVRCGDVRRHPRRRDRGRACAPATRCPAATTASRWAR